jgi:hypothetical protein
MTTTKFMINLAQGVCELEGDREFVEGHIETLKELYQKFVDNSVLVANTVKKGPSIDTKGKPATSGEADDSGDSAKHDISAEEIKNLIGPLDLRESEIEYVTALAYYLTISKQRATASLAEIEECYRLIGRPVPQINKAVQNAAYKNKWLEKHKDGGIILTRVGRNFIEHPETTRGSKSTKGVRVEENGDSKRKSSASAPTLKVKGDLDLYGTTGHVAFKEFCESKGITEKTSNAEKFAVSAYYLTQHVGQPTFDEHDIYTCFDHMRWVPPSFIRNNLINHKNQFGYYTMDEGKFAVTLKLKIFVERELVKGPQEEASL